MLSRLRAAGLLLPTIMTLVSLAVLVSLGNWQMSRKYWKDGLVAQIAARSISQPAAPAAVLDDFAARRDVEYTRLSVRGRFHNDGERFLYAPHPKLGPGYHVLTPFEITGPVASGHILFVNRGYVSEALRDRDRRKPGLVEGETVVVGLVRMPQAKAAFTPPNQPAQNIWYWRDLSGLMASAFPAGDRKLVPFMLDAEAEPAVGGRPQNAWPKGGATEVKLPNRHLEYALTWFGLAAALIAVYGVYAVGRLRATAAA